MSKQELFKLSPHVATILLQNLIDDVRSLINQSKEAIASTVNRPPRCVNASSIVVVILHAFQKKSKKGIATPKQEIELIHTR